MPERGMDDLDVEAPMLAGENLNQTLRMGCRKSSGEVRGTGGKGADVVVDLVGRAETLRFAKEVLAVRGRLILLTTFRDVATELSPRDMVLKELTVVGSRYASKWEVLQAAELVASGRIRPVISDVRRLEEVEGIHDKIRKGTLLGRGAVQF